MPALFALGQHAALAEVRRYLRPDECLLAYLDDIYVITSPERARVVFDLLSLHLHLHAHMQLHRGKTRVWNVSGLEPPGIRELGSVTDPVWVGDRARVWWLSASHAAILPLLRHSSSSRGPSKISSSKASALCLTCSPLGCCFCSVPLLGTHVLRALPPVASLAFAESHDAAACETLALQIAQLPFQQGGLNLRSGVALAPAAYWASWADTLPVGDPGEASCPGARWTCTLGSSPSPGRADHGRVS